MIVAARYSIGRKAIIKIVSHFLHKRYVRSEIMSSICRGSLVLTTHVTQHCDEDKPSSHGCGQTPSLLRMEVDKKKSTRVYASRIYLDRTE